VNTCESLRDDLSELPIAKVSAVMLHASLRKIGPIQGGPEVLLDVILELLPEDSPLLMPLGSNDNEPFNAKTSPAEVEIGALAEIFRRRKDTIVNDHVAGRFGAIGKGGEYLLNPTPLHDYLGPGSVLERFTQINGSVLRIGADLDTVTLTHYAEYLADIPNKKRVTRSYQRADIGDQEIESLDDSDGIVAWSGGDYFSQILIEFLNSGQVLIGKVGEARAELFEAQSFVRFSVDWLESNFKKLNL